MRCPNEKWSDSKGIFFPCGKCYVCTENLVKEWSVRLQYEGLAHDHAYFVTLTYEDDYLPLAPIESVQVAEDEYEFHHFVREDSPHCRFSEMDVSDYPLAVTLWKRDLQLFLKRLRKHVPLRYYAVGEYGTQTKRPHYHLIIYTNYEKVSDCPRAPIVDRGTCLDTCRDRDCFGFHLASAWSYGRMHCGYVEPRSIRYVASWHTARYEHTGPSLRPFSLCSRRPGLGDIFFETLGKRYYEEDNSAYVYDLAGNFARMPRFFRDRIFPSHTRDIQGQESLTSLERENSRSYISRKRSKNKLLNRGKI